jgi:hypothetical protein
MLALPLSAAHATAGVSSNRHPVRKLGRREHLLVREVRDARQHGSVTGVGPKALEPVGRSDRALANGGAQAPHRKLEFAKQFQWDRDAFLGGNELACTVCNECPQVDELPAPERGP